MHRHWMESVFPVALWRGDGIGRFDIAWSRRRQRIRMQSKSHCILSHFSFIAFFFLSFSPLYLQGLPAIVGCERVTQVFRSGDVVILDGTKGTITRVDEASLQNMD